MIDYFSAKVDKLGALSRTSNLSVGKNGKAEQEVVPLFATLSEPSEEHVGFLIDLKCGHTQRPSDLESIMFTVHLEAAGFMKGKGNVGTAFCKVCINVW